MSPNNFNLARLPQVDLLQNENHVFQPFFLEQTEEIPCGLRPGIGYGERRRELSRRVGRSFR